MRRYSIAWWLAILPTTVIVGVPTFYVLGYQTDWGVTERIALALVCAFVVDLATAAMMERIAPTKVSIGPGEKLTNTEIAAEEAIIVSGFASSAEGQVLVRGETWDAVRSHDETDSLLAGTAVRVIDRIGLRLVISAKSK
ncbi:MAG: NfeD family protein [Gammaproteobacteria bacterium]|nr:NfeD family protein [Gammaproteobacteria bacterium]